MFTDWDREREEHRRRFEPLSAYDSMIFVEIPATDIAEARDYQEWLLETVEMPWMTAFNSGNGHYRPSYFFNEEHGIHGNFGGMYIRYCKFYRFDGSCPAYSADDFRAKRGFLIRDHYGEEDVIKVHHIADNLEAFLSQWRIPYSRKNFLRHQP